MCQETATLFHALTTAAGWGETAAQMRQRVLHNAVAHNHDVWSGLPLGQHMQDVFLEERRRYNPREEAEVNATRFPSYEVRMSTDRVYGTILEACVASINMGREVLVRQENSEEWHRFGVTGAPRIYLQHEHTRRQHFSVLHPVFRGPASEGRQ